MRKRVLTSIALSVLCAALPLRAQEAPLTPADLFTLHSLGVSGTEISTAVASRGLSFPWTSAWRAAFRERGMTAAVTEVVGKAAAKAMAPRRGHRRVLDTSTATSFLLPPDWTMRRDGASTRLRHEVPPAGIKAEIVLGRISSLN